MKKKLLSLLLLGGLTLTAGAQQLPNIGFANWKTECGTTEAFEYVNKGNWLKPNYVVQKQGDNLRPGIEPESWNGSSVNQTVMGQNKQQELIFNDDNAVKMQNTFVGVLGIGSVAPGFINLGIPWVHAESAISECDGGAYGGVAFTHKPDAITGRYKRTDATGETSHIIAYLWSGTFVSNVGRKTSPNQARNNVDRAILGKTTPTSSGTLIASCDYTFTSTTNSDWQTITVPLTYYNTTTAPTMMNAIISAGDYWTRENMVDGTTLYADDVKFVYYSRLESLSYNGASLDVPAIGGTLDMSTVVYDSNQLLCTPKGQSATITKTYDSATAKLAITVSNVGADIDGLSSHTYYIQFAMPSTALAGVLYEGNILESFDPSVYEYTLNGFFTESIFLYFTEDSENAFAELAYENRVATITVTNALGGTPSVYKFNFTQDAPNLLSPTMTFTDNLVVTINGNSTDPQETTINVKKYDNGSFTLSLDNFVLKSNNGDLCVGNIVLEYIPYTEENGIVSFNANQLIIIQPGNYAAYWMGPELGFVPVVLSAKMCGDKLYCEIDIDMQESLGQVINVVFGKPIVAQTQSAAITEIGEAHVVLNRQFLKGWNTICLPFATTPEAVAGTGAKAQAFAGAGADGLDFVVAETMTANTPYLIYVPADTEAQTFIANVTLEDATPAPVTDGDFTFKGNYVANMPMADLYGVADKDGVQKIMKGSATAKLQGTRAYFDYSGASSVSGMRLNLEGQDDVTSIDGVEVMNGSFDIYNLQGIRVRTAATSLEGLGRGVYVVNGKKVMVK